MKVLLLADIAPCKNFPEGLALDQLCRFFPRCSLACFVVANRFVEAEVTGDLDWIPVAHSTNRIEQASRSSNRFLSFPLAWSVETLRRRLAVPRLAARAIDFGRREGVDLVWAVLQGQSLIQIASEVAQSLGVPLVTQVRNVPLWSLLEHQIDRFNRRATLSDFDRAVRASRVCVTATPAMSARYQEQYGTPCAPLAYGYPADWSKSPNLEDFPGATIEIGVTSIPDAPGEWLQLLRALNMSGWQVRSRRVRVNVIGVAPAPGEAPAGSIRHFGWRNSRETVDILSTMDILYLPVQFFGIMEDAARLTYPKNMPLYLAAGRPILLHAPASAAASDYLRNNQAGHTAPDFHAAAIYNELCRLVDGPSEYRRLGAGAMAAFRRDFTVESARSNFQRVLDVATGSPKL